MKKATNHGADMKVTPLSLAAGFVLLLTIVVPSVAYMRGAGSMAAGVFAVSLAHIYLSLIINTHHQRWPSERLAILTMLAALIIVSISGGLCMVLHSEVNVFRLIGSEIFFIIFILGAYTLARAAHTLSQSTFDSAIRMVFYVLLLSGIMGVLHISPFSSIAAKAVVFFNEPSHYSLSFLPFLFYMVLTAGVRMRIFLILTCFSLALLLESMTLMVGGVVICLVVLRMRHLLLLSPVVAIALLYISLDYYAQRMNFSAESSNYSTLVFLSGWERAYLNLKETYGLGVGFQQFGIIGSHGMFSDIIAGLMGKRLGVLDGGSVGAKFIGEFGILGVALIVVYIFSVIRKVRQLRQADQRPEQSLDKKQIFFIACFIMFGIDLFVRGIAYFSPSGLLFATSLLWLIPIRMGALALRPLTFKAQ